MSVPDHIRIETRYDDEDEPYQVLFCDNCESVASLKFRRDEPQYRVEWVKEHSAHTVPTTPWVDVYDICPEVSIDFGAYLTSERDNIDPALESAGYTLVGDWRTGDGDSFGPLTRWRRVTKDDQEYRVIYG